MHPLIRKVARNIVLPAAYGLGLQHLLSAFSSHDKLILCYHGVDVKSSLPYNGRHITRENFERHLRYFKRHFNTVTFSELFRLYREDATPSRPTLALTFDDGYLNNFQHALPLLEQYEIPVTFFVSSICMEDPDFVLWPDVIDVLRVGRGAKGIQFEDYNFLPSSQNAFRLYDVHSGTTLYDVMKGMGPESRKNTLDELKAKYHFEKMVEADKAYYWQLMNREQLQTLAASPWAEVGSHTHRHFNLANIDVEDARFELEISKKILQEVVQKEVDTLAFPDGNYNAEVKALSKAAGYKCLGALRYRLPDDPDDPFILPRENVSGTTNYYSQIIHMHQQMSIVGV